MSTATPSDIPTNDIVEIIEINLFRFLARIYLRPINRDKFLNIYTDFILKLITMITYMGFKMGLKYLNESADDFLLSPGGARLSSALTCFTSEFGKGSGGTELLCSSAFVIILSLINMSTKNIFYFNIFH